VTEAVSSTSDTVFDRIISRYYLLAISYESKFSWQNIEKFEAFTAVMTKVQVLLDKPPFRLVNIYKFNYLIINFLSMVYFRKDRTFF